MKPSRFILLYFFLTSFTILSLSWGCGKKPSAPRAKVPSVNYSRSEEGIKEFGISLYPGAESLDNSTVNSERTRVPKSDKPIDFYETLTASTWLASSDSVEKIQQFYSKQNPFVITEERLNGEVSFVQIASVEDINKAIAEHQSPIFLINIRKSKLSAAERSAYENEMRSLRALNQPDSIQKKRLRELERALHEKTLIQINLRAIRS